MLCDVLLTLQAWVSILCNILTVAAPVLIGCMLVNADNVHHLAKTKRNKLLKEIDIRLQQCKRLELPAKEADNAKSIEIYLREYKILGELTSYFEGSDEFYDYFEDIVRQLKLNLNGYQGKVCLIDKYIRDYEELVKPGHCIHMYIAKCEDLERRIDIYFTKCSESLQQIKAVREVCLSLVPLAKVAGKLAAIGEYVSKYRELQQILARARQERQELELLKDKYATDAADADQLLSQYLKDCNAQPRADLGERKNWNLLQLLDMHTEVFESLEDPVAVVNIHMNELELFEQRINNFLRDCQSLLEDVEAAEKSLPEGVNLSEIHEFMRRTDLYLKETEELLHQVDVHLKEFIELDRVRDTHLKEVLDKKSNDLKRLKEELQRADVHLKKVMEKLTQMEKAKGKYLEEKCQKLELVEQRINNFWEDCRSRLRKGVNLSDIHKFKRRTDLYLKETEESLDQVDVHLKEFIELDHVRDTHLKEVLDKKRNGLKRLKEELQKADVHLKSMMLTLLQNEMVIEKHIEEQRLHHNNIHCIRVVPNCGAGVFLISGAIFAAYFIVAAAPTIITAVTFASGAGKATVASSVVGALLKLLV